MKSAPELIDKVFSIGEKDLEELALEIFRFQSANNALYALYLEVLKCDPVKVNSLFGIPFLPIGFFKSHEVKTGSFEPGVIFESSGTTGSGTSRHFIKDLSLYERSFISGFKKFYGDPAGWCILALIPSFAERDHSSLAYMTDKLIRLSGHSQGGFYLDRMEDLQSILSGKSVPGRKILLIGLTYALLDLAEKINPVDIGLDREQMVIMETGGMKGRRKEMIREEVHEILKRSFGVSAIHSEYGMSELLSQAYSTGNGVFRSVPWMKVLVREEDEPRQVNAKGRGAVNIIDLANIYSCSFIATEDAGEIFDDGSFKILGRLDESDLRGCNLMIG
jgi:hypothetical protein